MKITYTRRKLNPYLAESDDGRNMAFGRTREEAAANLERGIAARGA